MIGTFSYRDHFSQTAVFDFSCWLWFNGTWLDFSFWPFIENIFARLNSGPAPRYICVTAPACFPLPITELLFTKLILISIHLCFGFYIILPFSLIFPNSSFGSLTLHSGFKSIRGFLLADVYFSISFQISLLCQKSGFTTILSSFRHLPPMPGFPSPIRFCLVFQATLTQHRALENVAILPKSWCDPG